MQSRKLIGEKIFLRKMVESDIDENYVNWFTDDVVTSFLVAKNIDLEAALQFYRLGIETKSHVQLAICDNSTNEMIGSVKIGPIDRQNMVSDLVTIIGNRDYWGKGLAKEAIHIASKYAFQELKIRKVTGGINSGNIGSIKGYTGGGWLVEGILAGHYLHGIETQDRVIVSCFNPDYFSKESLEPIEKFSSSWLSNLKKL